MALMSGVATNVLRPCAVARSVPTQLRRRRIVWFHRQPCARVGVVDGLGEESRTLRGMPDTSAGIDANTAHVAQCERKVATCTESSSSLFRPFILGVVISCPRRGAPESMRSALIPVVTAVLLVGLETLAYLKGGPFSWVAARLWGLMGLGFLILAIREILRLSLIHISEPTRPMKESGYPS